MPLTYLSLGSNLGDRQQQLREAAAALQQRGVRIIRRAPLYETEPKDVREQPWFLNTVIEGETRLSPDQLLRACLEIEIRQGRVRDRARGPRTIDIDIVFYDNRIVRTPELTIPHPRFRERRFVLEPLRALAPDFVDPETGRSVRELADATDDPARIELYTVDWE